MAVGVGGEVVAARGVGGGEACERGFGGGGPPEFEELAVEAVTACAGDEVDDGPGGGAVLGGEGVGEDGHLRDGHEWDVGEDGLAAPHVDVVGAVGFEPGLAAACAVGGEEVLVHKDVALVDGGAVGGFEEGEKSEAAGGEGGVVDLLLGEVDA